MTRAYNFSVWTDEKDAILRLTWPDPAISAPQIAVLVGQTAEATARRAKKVLKLGPKVRPSTWTAEREESLRALWKDPSNGTRDLAKEFGVARNSIIRKVREMGLPARLGRAGPKPATIRKRVAKARAEAAEPRLPTIQAQPFRPEVIPATAKTLLEMNVERNECRRPVGPDNGPGEGHRQLFCAAPTDEGQSYCPTCLPRMFSKSRSPEQRASEAAHNASIRAKYNKPGINEWLFPTAKGKAA